MTGVYLTIATLAFALIIQEVLTHWDKVRVVSRGSRSARP
jgi:ABC-type branched-subunit amino acid transport system permease subunit